MSMKSKMVENASKCLLVLSLIFIIIGAFFLYKGYDVKNNYYNSEYSSIASENAYVGGDAYNYIINGTYFSGYMCVGMGCFTIAAIFLTGSIFVMVNESTTMKIEADELPEL